VVSIYFSFQPPVNLSLPCNSFLVVIIAKKMVRKMKSKIYILILPLLVLVFFGGDSSALQAKKEPVKKQPLVTREEREEYILIKGLISDGIYEIATRRIELFIEKYPESGKREELAYYLGEGYFRLHRFDKAEKALSSFIAEFPQGKRVEEASFLLAVSYRLLERNDEAEAKFKEIAGKKDFSREVRLEARKKLAELYLSEQRLKEAVSYLKGLYKETRELPYAVELARSYFTLRDYKQAELGYRDLIEKQGEQLDRQLIKEAYYRLGLISYREEDYSKAEVYFTSAVEADAGFKEGIIALAWTCYRQKKDKEAYDHILRVVEERKETEAEALCREGRVLLFMNEREAAIKAFSRAAQFENDKAARDALLALVGCYSGEGELDQAIKALDRFLRIEDDPEVLYREWYHLASLYFKKGDYQSASDAFLKVVSLNERGALSDRALMMAAQSELKLNSQEKAMAALSRLVKGFPQSDLLVDSYFTMAGILRDMGRPIDAAGGYQAIAEHFLDREIREEAIFAAGRCYYDGDKWDKAVELFSRFIKEFSHSERIAEAHYYLGRSCYQEGKYETGVSHFKTAVEEGVGENWKRLYPDALFCLGFGRYRLADYDEACSAFLELGEKGGSPEHQARGFYFLGLSHLAAGRLSESNDAFSELISRFPDNELAEHSLFMLGDNYLALNEEEKAIELFSRLVSDFPQGEFAAVAKKRLKEIYLAKEDYKALLSAIPEFTLGNPGSLTDASDLLDKANALITRGRIRQAIATYKSLLAQFPKSPVSDRASFELAELYSRRKGYQQAILYYKKVISDFPGSGFSPRAERRLGNIYFEQKRFKEAIPHFLNLVNDPDFAEVKDRISYLLGYSYEQIGDLKSAIPYYEAFLTYLADPGVMIKEQLRLILLLQSFGRYEQAVSACRSVLVNTRDEETKTEVNFYLAESLARLGRTEEAVLEYLKVTYLHARNPMWALTACFRAGEIYEREGKYDEAIKLYTKVAEKYKGEKKGDYASKRVKELKEKITSAKEKIEP
jgi:TolA-binding protein